MDIIKTFHIIRNNEKYYIEFKKKNIIIVKNTNNCWIYNKEWDSIKENKSPPNYIIEFINNNENLIYI